MLPDPTLLGYKIHWYLFFHYAGLVVAVIFGIYYYRKKNHDKTYPFRLFVLLITSFILMLVGARIAGLFEAYVSTGNWHWDILFLPPSMGRFRWAGAVAALILILPTIGKILRVKNFFQYFDVMAISVCLLTVFTKQGCLFSGDGCHGIPTELPWGVYFPYGVAPNILPVHPTPIYDSIFHLLLFAGLWFWDSTSKRFAGQTALLYFVIAPAFYILLEMIRINPKTSLGLTVPQIIYFMVLLGAIPWLISRKGLVSPNNVGTNT